MRNDKDRRPRAGGPTPGKGTEAPGTARSSADTGIEGAKATGQDRETEDLLEAIASRESLMRAAERVARNRGAGGVDGMGAGEIVGWLEANLGALRGRLMAGSYRPQPALRVEIPKREKGKTRKLGIPTAIDRCVQQAVLDALTPIFDPHFSEESFGFRPGRSAHDALEEALRLANEGNTWAVCIDLASFFDEVDHARLTQLVSERVADGRVVSLVHRFLKAGVMVDGVRQATEKGTPQGGPLSPLLANVMLDPLDRELERRGHAFVRYADDVLILKASRRAAERTMEAMVRFIEDRLLLKVNRDKSFVARITDGRVKYLGCGFWRSGDGVRLRAHPKSVAALKDKVRGILARSNGDSLDWRRERLAWLVRGWVNYFRLADMRQVLRRLDEWVRRKVRCVYWKCWKRVRTRFRALVRLGISRQQAWEWANSRKAYWRVAGSGILHRALDNATLSDLGWTLFLPYYLAVRN